MTDYERHFGAIESQLENSLIGQPERVGRSALVPPELTLAGLLMRLEGFQLTLSDGYHIDYLERDKNFKQWSQEAIHFFHRLKASDKISCFEVGKSEVPAHRLLPFGDDDYALYESIELFPRSVYLFDYAEMKRVAPDAAYDLPLGNHSEINQLYLGNIEKGVAVSLNQLTQSLLDGGRLELLPRSLIHSK